MVGYLEAVSTLDHTLAATNSLARDDHQQHKGCPVFPLSHSLVRIVLW